MSLIPVLYNAIFKRSSTFAAFIVGTVFLTDRVIDGTADYVFDRINEGKLWEHIKPE